MSFTNVAFGLRLKAARKRLGLTLEDVAARTGLHIAGLSRLEHGAAARLLPPEQIVVLGDVLNLSLHEMLIAAGFPLGDECDGARS